jgi:hypothetical protein
MILAVKHSSEESGPKPYGGRWVWRVLMMKWMDADG